MKEIFKNPARQKAVCIQADDIAALAQQGLERALAARQAMSELSEEQAKDVGGGAIVLSKAIIAGGIRMQKLNNFAGMGGVATLPSMQTQFG